MSDETDRTMAVSREADGQVVVTWGDGIKGTEGFRLEDVEKMVIFGYRQGWSDASTATKLNQGDSE